MSNYYHALIKKTDTGEERLCRFESAWDSEVCLFGWQEGNFSCDCNRSDFFRKAGGEPEVEDAPCGHSGYSVPYVILPDGMKTIIDDVMQKEKSDV